MGRRPQKLELTWFNKDQALIPTEEGKYGYTWVDPKDPRYCETHTLIIDDVVCGTQSPKEDGITYSERADLDPTEDNLLILGESGDVLEALTRVPELAEKYVGQVKCIYIDPPFNTAQTFANYEDNLEHSIWLTMMRDRLIHLRRLLSDEGSIWVHLDDVENHRMRLLMDEVFGAGNFVADVSWLASDSSSNNAKVFSRDKNAIIVYSKDSGWRPNFLPDTERQSHFKNPDNDPRGPWFDGHNVQNPKDRPALKYEIATPSGNVIQPPTNGWRWELKTMLQKMETGEIYFNADETSLKRKTYLYEQDGLPPSDAWFSIKKTGSSRQSKNHLKQLFPGIPTPDLFDTPKAEKLIAYILKLATDPGDLVVDVFAGSGTTAAVAHKMGRRWVTCELLESTMERFTLPRLTKVVRGEDPGGITLTKGERVDATAEGLPEGISAEEAQKLTSLLNKAISENDNLKKSKDIRELKALVKTSKSKDTVNWRGGGSFTVAHLSPSCFDYDPELDLVTLTEAATGQTLVESVAANLNFRLTPQHRYFHGVRGAMRLVVVEGRLDRAKVDDLIAHLEDEDGLTIAATEIDDGVRQYLRTLGRGCRAVHVPSEIFTYSVSEEQ
ncbi:site-specific DNA-methyltransferase [Corynebacterium halotolerans]|uniref:site-specific DNA-methyltransferase n=1 Tax=Corynebacterium halotolerans TaxID=225326 RepID=UPI003CEA2C66